MDRTTIQRVRSHGASLNHRAFDLADQFLDGFFASCPRIGALARRFPGSPAAQRRAVAHRWAWFVRNLGQLNHVTPELEAFYTLLHVRGLGAPDLHLARLALLDALREISGAGWTPQLETDWACAFDHCLGLMSPAASIPLPTEQRYALAA